jgi:hypothetical protein
MRLRPPNRAPQGPMLFLSNTRTYVCMYAYIHTYKHTYLHTYVYIQTYIHTYIHNHAPQGPRCSVVASVGFSPPLSASPYCIKATNAPVSSSETLHLKALRALSLLSLLSSTLVLHIYMYIYIYIYIYIYEDLIGLHRIYIYICDADQ